MNSLFVIYFKATYVVLVSISPLNIWNNQQLNENVVIETKIEMCQIRRAERGDKSKKYANDTYKEIVD
jgi:hypothetical protein